MKLKIKLRNILSVKIHKIVLLLLALCIYNTAYGQNHRISVYGNNQSLQKVFEQIEEQTQLSITYNQTRLDVNRKIKGNFVDKELSFVMDALLKNTGFTCRYEAEHIVITPVEQKTEKAAAGQATQMKKITGKVTGVTGEPLIGANVLAVGGKQATITNLEGEFSLEVSDNSKLQVTYIGYLPQEVSTNGKTHFVIQLKEDSQLMDEVVVVGFGTQKKVNLTGAVTAVNIQETLGDRPITNVTAALQGVVPGLKIEGTTGTPGDNLSYNIRGTTSINGGGPLVLVNNVPMDINMIDPQDIESVSVLKDAASAAIYGSRSANGVIIITTKSGQEGKARIDIKYNHSWGTLSHKVPQANRKERLLYDQYRKEYFETYGGGNPDESSDILNDPLNSFFNVDNDYLDMITSTAQKDQVDISVGGGTKKLKYFINTGYYNEKGIISNTGFQRLNTRINSDYSPTDWMNMGSRISLTYSKKKGLNEGTLLSAVLTRRPYFNTYYPDGSLVGVFNGQKNPIAQVNYTTDFTDSYKANFFQFFEIKFNKYLKFRANINANFYLDKRKKLEPSLITDEWQKQNKGYSYNYLNWNWMNEDILTYARKIKDHNFTAMVGVSAQQWRYENETFVGINSSTDFIYTMNAFAANLDLSSTGSTLSNHSMASIFARVTYDYKGRYLLNAIMRRDGSSRFAPGHRWGTFPSVSAGWRISGEKFMQPLQDIVTDLKLRAGWGMNGNQGGFGNYAYMASMSVSKLPVSEGNLYPGLAIKPGSAANKELTWEKTSQWNLGLDLTMFDSRLSFSVDAYYKKTTDLLLTVSLPENVVPSSVTRNDGEMVNKGMEFTLSSQNFKGNFQWNTDFNISFNRNKLTKLGLNKVYYYAEMYESKEKAVILKEGLPLGTFFGYISEGVDPETGDIIYRDLNGNGFIDPEDRTTLGNAQPKFIYGMTNTFSYAGFDLSVFLQGSQGNKIFNASRIDMEGMTDFRNQSVRVLDRWKRPGMITNVPRVGNTENNHNSSRFVEDGSYLRLKTVTLSYNFPKKWLNKIHLSRLQAYVTGQNLFTLTKYKGYDPEVNAFGGDSVAQGVDYGTYPQSRAVIFGLNVEF